MPLQARRLRETPTLYTPQVAKAAPTPEPVLTCSPRALVWHYLYDAPRHSPAGDRVDVAYLAPGLPQAVRVTTDPEYYDQHCDSVELWSPGSPLFPPPVMIPEPTPSKGITRGEFLALLGDRQK
ncbi:hypothetical protein RHP47_11420 [Thermosynechococcus sp. QKsg1]|uniref:hypothetical protein n=1 Tax=unclassified Thermosynechococcus TaxID=2622553 RepID=UPI0025765182|nr:MULTISPECIES: hypothetical protein [unclassified Thermosynechococcus]WJI26318.1 hypothetical protein M0644_11490 [Thermosynechococcus sp. B1]WNC86436.1 hypothetical protein RHP47_11420 [Thermosynechococcus sp. QKsg1]